MFFGNKNKKNKVKILGKEKKPWRRKKTSASSFSLGKIFFYLLALVFLGTVVYFFFFSSYLAVNSIEIKGTQKIDSEKVKNAFTEKISGKFLEVVPKNNLLIISKNSMEKYLSDKFNRIENLEIKKTFPEKVIISIKEKQFQLIFAAGENKYLIDEKGSAWPKNDFELDGSEEENLILLADESGKAIENPKAVLEVDFIKYVLAVRKGIQKETGIEISRNFYSPRLISGDLKVETKEGWKIYFNQEISLEKSLKILKSVLDDNRIKKEDVANLEYLDLRINNKVYYKFKSKDITLEEKPTENQENKEKK